MTRKIFCTQNSTYSKQKRQKLVWNERKWTKNGWKMFPPAFRCASTWKLVEIYNRIWIFMSVSFLYNKFPSSFQFHDSFFFFVRVSVTSASTTSNTRQATFDGPALTVILDWSADKNVKLILRGLKLQFGLPKVTKKQQALPKKAYRSTSVFLITCNFSILSGSSAIVNKKLRDVFSKD